MRNRLLIFGSFADDAKGVLAAVYRLALMCIEGGLDFSLCQIGRFLAGYKRGVTTFTDACQREVNLDNAQIALWHGLSLAHLAESI